MEIAKEQETMVKEFIFEEEPIDLIKPEGYVLLIDNRGMRKLIDLRQKSGLRVKWKKKMIDIGSCIGHPFNSIFDLTPEGTLQLCEDPEAGMAKDVLRIEEEDEASDNEGIEEERDNRNFFANDPSTQKMTTEDIVKMKEEGKVGQELIQEIAKNNENFDQKTLFSQKKYLKRKMEKHIARFRILRTNLQNVAETIFLDEASNISNLRWDALSLLIHKSNLAVASEILVLDNAQGLLVASALLRCEKARVTCMYMDEQRPSMNRYNCLSFLNMSQEILSRFSLAPYADIIDESNTTHNKKYDTVLISSDFEPSKLLPRLIPCLKTSGTLAVFSPYLEPLESCFEMMVTEKAFINVKIHDIFMREFQVLKLRTHPLMNMHAYSGFILSGIRVQQPVIVHTK